MTATRIEPATRAPFGARAVLPLAASAILNPINSTMIAVALVPIGIALGAGPAETTWLISALYLATAIGQPVVGALVDRYGARRVLLTGAILVMVAGVAGIFPVSLGWLIGARVLLGVGTCAGFPAAMAILRERADAAGQDVPARALSVLAISNQTIMVIGPTLGGALIWLFGWPSVFVVNVPLGAIALLSALFLVRKDGPVQRRPEASETIGVGAVLRRGPLLRTYLRQALTFLLIYSVMFGYVQWLEHTRGLSESASGALLLPMSLVAVTAAALSGKANGILPRLLITALSVCAGGGLLLLVDRGTSVPALIGLGLIFGVVQGLTSVTNQTVLYRQAPRGRIGAASGLFRSAQYVGAIVSSAMIAVCFGGEASSAGLHRLALALTGIGLVLLVLTAADPALRRDRLAREGTGGAR